ASMNWRLSSVRVALSSTVPPLPDGGESRSVPDPGRELSSDPDRRNRNQVADAQCAAATRLRPLVWGAGRYAPCANAVTVARARLPRARATLGQTIQTSNRAKLIWPKLSTDTAVVTSWTPAMPIAPRPSARRPAASASDPAARRKNTERNHEHTYSASLSVTRVLPSWTSIPLPLR